MAEKIGYISFSAFDYKRSTEFESIRRNSYDRNDLTQSFFDKNPAIPRWKVMAHIGNEPMQRKTPPEYQPLMNEYHRYFYENAVQHEAYLRWVRRHRIWDRETEVFFGRFTQLRDFLNEKFAAQDYARRGRIHQIYDSAMQKAWLNSELLERASENEALEQKIRNARALQKKLESQALYRERAYQIPDEREAFQRREDVTRISGTTHENRIPLNVNIENTWSHGLAIAHYQQELQRMPIAPATLNTNTAAGNQTPLAPPVTKKVSGLG